MLIITVEQVVLAVQKMNITSGMKKSSPNF